MTTAEQTRTMSAEAVLNEGQESVPIANDNYQFWGYLPLIQSDGKFRIVGISGGYNDEGVAATRIFTPAKVPHEVTDAAMHSLGVSRLDLLNP